MSNMWRGERRLAAYFFGMAFSSDLKLQSIPLSAAFSRGSPTYTQLWKITHNNKKCKKKNVAKQKSKKCVNCHPKLDRKYSSLQLHFPFLFCRNVISLIGNKYNTNLRRTCSVDYVTLQLQTRLSTIWNDNNKSKEN